MKPEQRTQIKKLLDNLEDCVGAICREDDGILCEPTTHPKDALGTDGGCWTDEQLCEYAKKLCQNVSKILRRV